MNRRENQPGGYGALGQLEGLQGGMIFNPTMSVLNPTHDKRCGGVDDWNVYTTASLRFSRSRPYSDTRVDEEVLSRTSSRLHPQQFFSQVKMSWCWLFHRWGKWENVPVKDPLYVLQRRYCTGCGKVEAHFLRKSGRSGRLLRPPLKRYTTDFKKGRLVSNL